ncbi:MAG: efflux RND transporter periplasmic adaptor subunit [Reichenbachiella sp.]
MNTNKKTIIIASFTLIIGVLLGWLLFSNSSDQVKEEHKHVTEVFGETTWTCSMHPQVRKNEPGDCPICGMTLILLDNTDDEIDPMAVRMSSTAMQLANVQTAIVESGDASKSIRVNGKVQTDERLMFTQSSHIPGRIEKLTVNFTGDLVKKGQVIAYVYSPELVNAQEELFEAKKIKDTQPALFNAAKEKLKNWKLTNNQINQILAAEKAIEQFPILANVSGYVTKRLVNLGDYIKLGQPIYKIADLSKVWVLFDVYESDMSSVSKGDKIRYTVQSLQGETFEGVISFVDPTINPKTRVAQVRLEVSNKSQNLKPEMFVSGIIQSNVGGNSTSISVPKTAIMWTGKRSVAYIKTTTAQGVSFIMREVVLGPTLGDSYLIESGLQPGEEVAVNGTFSIDAAAQLAGKPSMMNREGGVTMTGHNYDGKAPVYTSQSHKGHNQQVAIKAEAKKMLKPLYLDYMSIKGSLINDDFMGAKKSVVLFQRDLKKFNMSLFTGEAHQVWMNYSSQMQQAILHAAHFQNIEEMRSAFQVISNAMIGLTKSFDPLEESMYVQYCPMVNEDMGADWLSFTDEIKNPYFGKSMPTCGEIKEVIK